MRTKLLPRCKLAVSSRGFGQPSSTGTLCEPRSTTLAKKIETATQAKHRRVHAREVTRLRHVRAVVSILLARVVDGPLLPAPERRAA